MSFIFASTQLEQIKCKLSFCIMFQNNLDNPTICTRFRYSQPLNMTYDKENIWDNDEHWRGMFLSPSPTSEIRHTYTCAVKCFTWDIWTKIVANCQFNFNDELFQDYHWDCIYFENIFQDINVSYHLQTLFNWIRTLLIWELSWQFSRLDCKLIDTNSQHQHTYTDTIILILIIVLFLWFLLTEW